LIHFSNADNLRSLPSVIDGLKPSQRKVLFGCFKRGLKDEVKVAQLSGYVAEHSAYHHGEMSLQQTIIGMAQNFMGSNNINLLFPSGQFGTRLAGGKDAASPRYIFTRLEKVARAIYPEVDDGLLDYVEDDGIAVEPRIYSPVIPMVLVNGAQGIGTGWSTFIPSYNPLDLIKVTRSKLDPDTKHTKRKKTKLVPFVRGFKGSIDIDPRIDTRFVTSGKIESIDSTTVAITELPVGKWNHDFRLNLLRMQDRGQIKSFDDQSTTDKILFVVKLSRRELLKMTTGTGGLLKAFGLTSNLNTGNMNAFNRSGEIVTYDSPDAMVDEFFEHRLELYTKRREFLKLQAKRENEIIKNRVDFISLVQNPSDDFDLVRDGASKKSILVELQQRGFSSMQQINRITSCDDEIDSGNDGNNRSPEGDDDNFDYLLSMPLTSFSSERIEKLLAEKSVRQDDLSRIENTTAQDLWKEDLDRLEEILRGR